MQITSKLNQQDFVNANFALLYSKQSTRLYTAFIILCLLASIVLFVLSRHGSAVLILLSLVMLAIVPLKTYYVSKQNFTANKRSGETIEYQFDEDHLFMKGSSFSSQSRLDKIYKLTKTRNWVLIWQNKQIAHPIPKRDITDRQLEDLKKILDNHNVTNNL